MVTHILCNIALMFINTHKIWNNDYFFSLLQEFIYSACACMSYDNICPLIIMHNIIFKSKVTTISRVKLSIRYLEDKIIIFICSGEFIN